MNREIGASVAIPSAAPLETLKLPATSGEPSGFRS
jgi:hypothetical protein